MKYNHLYDYIHQSPGVFNIFGQRATNHFFKSRGPYAIRYTVQSFYNNEHKQKKVINNITITIFDERT